MTSTSAATRSLLLVDDEPLILESFGQLLRNHLSCPVHTFLRPLDALASLPALNPGMILSDYSMPSMNGMSFLLEAQRLVPDAHFAIITGEPIEFESHELRLLPSLKGILRKPLPWRDLADFVVNHWPDHVPAPVFQQPAMAS